MNLLGNSFFSSQWFLIVVLVVVVGLLMFLSYSRSKKEQQYREQLNAKIVKGAKVKTGCGIYGTVVSIKNTTDGKIVLISTGEGKNVSYMEMHINAIFGVDDSEELVLDKDGNEVTPSELKAQEEEKKAEVNEEVEEKTEVVEKTDNVEEKPAEKKTTTKKAPAEKKTTKKSTK